MNPSIYSPIEDYMKINQEIPANEETNDFSMNALSLRLVDNWIILKIRFTFCSLKLISHSLKLYLRQLSINTPPSLSKKRVVSKKRNGVTGNGVTRNRVTGLFSLFFFSDVVFSYFKQRNSEKIHCARWFLLEDKIYSCKIFC